MSFGAWLSTLSTLFLRPPVSGLGAAPNLQIQRMIFKTYCRKWVSGLGCQRYLRMIFNTYCRKWVSGLDCQRYQRMIFHTYSRKWVSGLGCQRYLRCFQDPQIQGWVQPRIYKFNVWFFTHIVENEFRGLVVNAIYVVFETPSFRAGCSPESTNSTYDF